MRPETKWREGQGDLVSRGERDAPVPSAGENVEPSLRSSSCTRLIHARLAVGEGGGTVPPSSQAPYAAHVPTRRPQSRFPSRKAHVSERAGGSCSGGGKYRLLPDGAPDVRGFVYRCCRTVGSRYRTNRENEQGASLRAPLGLCDSRELPPRTPHHPPSPSPLLRVRVGRLPGAPSLL